MTSATDLRRVIEGCIWDDPDAPPRLRRAFVNIDEAAPDLDLSHVRTELSESRALGSLRAIEGRCVFCRTRPACGADGCCGRQACRVKHARRERLRAERGPACSR